MDSFYRVTLPSMYHCCTNDVQVLPVIEDSFNAVVCGKDVSCCYKDANRQNTKENNYPTFSFPLETLVSGFFLQGKFLLGRFSPLISPRQLA